MRKLLIYILLVSHGVMLIRPVLPSFIDLLAHTFWYSQHMATVHFENGKYHVHYQYMEESKKNFAGKNGHSTKAEENPNDYLVRDIGFILPPIVTVSPEFIPSQAIIADIVLSKNYPPPKSSNILQFPTI